jgi:hypothetical protein
MGGIFNRLVNAFVDKFARLILREIPLQPLLLRPMDFFHAMKFDDITKMSAEFYVFGFIKRFGGIKHKQVLAGPDEVNVYLLPWRILIEETVDDLVENARVHYRKLLHALIRGGGLNFINEIGLNRHFVERYTA